jgi:hypothetical protein
MISFEAGSNWYEAGAELHHFRGYIDDRPVHCVISQIALTALSSDRARRGSPGDIFDAIEHRVFALAERKARINGCDRHGVVAINSTDMVLMN